MAQSGESNDHQLPFKSQLTIINYILESNHHPPFKKKNKNGSKAKTVHVHYWLLKLDLFD
jgi:hypothetical protein